MTIIGVQLMVLAAASLLQASGRTTAYVKGSLDNPGEVAGVSRNMEVAFDFLRSHDLKSLPVGKVEIAGDDVFAFVSTPVLRPFYDPNGLVEVHRRYIDVHVPIEGEETIGYLTLNGLPDGVEFNEKDDYALFPAKTAPLTVKPGEFVVFFPPAGAHRPACTLGDVPITNALRKICIKVKCEEKNGGACISVFNLDSTHYTGSEFGDDKMNAEGLREYVHRILGNGAFTHFFICPGAQTTLCDTKTMSPTWWRMGEPGVPTNDHMRRNYMMFTNGVDTIQVEIDAIRAHGVSPWLSMRMNDNHCANDPKAWLHSKFWVDHPEYRKQGGFDYSVPAVREYHLAFVKEMLDRYDVDGFECDWMRWPIRQEAGVLTDFMRRTRAIVDAAAKRRGHPILLGVRVATRPAAAVRYGTDAIAWAREKLVDWIVPANFFGSVDFDIPLDEWQKLVEDAGSSAKVIPCLDTGVMTKDPATKKLSPRRMLTLAEYCGWAERMYDRGAPGVYYFNLFTYFEKAYRVTDTTPWDFIVTHGLTPETIKSQPKSIPENWWYEP